MLSILDDKRTAGFHLLGSCIYTRAQQAEEGDEQYRGGFPQKFREDGQGTSTITALSVAVSVGTV